MYITEVTKAIREELKEKLGVNSRQVSVSKTPCGYSYEINVKIKDASVEIDKVRGIAEKYQKVRRDCFGEILEGCNRYVFVEYDYRLLSTLRKKYGDFLKSLAEKAITTDCEHKVCDGIFVYKHGKDSVCWFECDETDDWVQTLDEISEAYVLVHLEREFLKAKNDASDSKGNYQGDSF